MKEIRKYVSCVMITLLFACMIQIHTANAAASPSLSASADTAAAAKGDYVTIHIDLSGNPSISTLGMTLNYDSNMLSYDSATWNSAFSESDMKLASDLGSDVNLSVVCDSSYSEDGTVVTVRFRANSDLTSLPVTLSLRDMADADLNAVTDCIVSSQVRVQETEDNKNQGTDNQDNTADAKLPQTAAVAGSGVQQTPAQNTQSDQTSGNQSAQPDQNYKTGAGFGNDGILIIAAACGILALLLAVRKHGEEKK